MRIYILFFVLGMSLWTGFGAILGGLGAKLLNYTWVWQAVGYGTLSGAILGFFLSLTGLTLSSWLSSPKISLWLVVGALFGAVLGVVGLMLIGGYPTGTQADLVMAVMAPPTAIIGAIVGAIASLVTWKVYHR
jgi:hypothetical protein